MELRDALCQISEIRRQIARTEVFRGYRSLTVGFSGLLGLLGAMVQSLWITSPENSLSDYLMLWLSIAAVSLAVAGVELYLQVRRAGAGLTREMTQVAIEQFLPSILVGAVLTLCITRSAPQAAWMLPGLWSLTFGLGVFASCPLLPRQVWWAGVYYVLCGGGCLLWGQGSNAFSPWLMAISFGGGQILCAIILHRNLERGE